MAIKVRAINAGVYGLYREPGHEFEIREENHFSKKWMEKVEPEDEEESPKTKTKGKGKAKTSVDPEEESSEKDSHSEDVI